MLYVNNALAVSPSHSQPYDADISGSARNDPVARSSIEDLELETRALTEPLPTNQQVVLTNIMKSFFKKRKEKKKKRQITYQNSINEVNLISYEYGLPFFP